MGDLERSAYELPIELSQRIVKRTRETCKITTALLIQSLIALKKKIDKIGFEQLKHPPYSADVTPSDYYFFPKDERFSSNIMSYVSFKEWFADQDLQFFFRFFISRKRDYIEQIKFYFTMILDICNKKMKHTQK